MRLRCVWLRVLTPAVSPTLLPIESRTLRFARRSRCVWIGFEVRLRCLYHGFAQGADGLVSPNLGPIEFRALRFARLSRCV